MTTDSIQIVMCSDDNGADFMLVAIKSIFVNHRDSDIDMHVVTDGFSHSTLQSIARLAQRYGKPIHVHTADLSAAASLPEVNRPGIYIPRTMYLRLMLDTILPDRVKKVIYLDTDTIVEHSLSHLWLTDLKGNVMGAVTDVNLATDEHFSRLGLDDSSPYFNSGMLLIDMDAYRRLNIRKKCLDWISANSSIADYPDQDAINVVARGNILQVNPRYNVFDSFFRHINYGDRFMSTADWDNAVARPSVIHYTGLKPWLKYYPSVDIPMRERWHHYRNLDFISPMKQRQPVGSRGVAMRAQLRQSAALGWIYRISPSFWAKVAKSMKRNG